MPSPRILASVPLAGAVPIGNKSTVGEPSAARSGDVAMYSGNWYAARSFDGGATWSHLDPFTYFPRVDGGFCCDQSLIYDSSRDLFIWLLQYVVRNGQNTLRIAVCPSAEVQTDGWNYWDLTPAGVDPGWANDWFDYNHAALSNNCLYVGTNMFRIVPAEQPDPFQRCVIFRLSLDELSQGQGLTLEHFASNDFSMRCTLGATDTMYFGTHVNTARIRVYTWQEGQAGVTSTDIDVTRWRQPPPSFSAPHDQSANWMGRGDSRITGAWTANGELGFLWTANRQGVERPLPYVRAVRIDASSMTLIDEPDIWNRNFAFGWPEACPNVAGVLAVSLFVGGGVFHPSHVVGVRDAGTWRLLLSARGSHSPNDGKWGDYLHMRPNAPDGTSWVASAFTLQGGDDQRHIEPRFVHFDQV